MFHGATQVLFEGVPTHPDAGRTWQIIDRYQVSQLYTAPTVIRSLMSKGDDFVRQYTRASLKVLGTVGEPINPEAWKWYHEVRGAASGRELELVPFAGTPLALGNASSCALSHHMSMACHADFISCRQQAAYILRVHAPAGQKSKTMEDISHQHLARLVACCLQWHSPPCSPTRNAP